MNPTSMSLTFIIISFILAAQVDVEILNNIISTRCEVTAMDILKLLFIQN